jgi:hypothetical protein
MGTRGAVGFFQQGKEKVSYNHFDSYPECLGTQVLQWLRGTDLNRLPEQVEHLQLIKDDAKHIPDELIEKAKELGLTQLELAEHKVPDPYSLLRGAQGRLDLYLKLGWMLDNATFLHDSLFCEYAYIVNLDDQLLEVYAGFNKDPAAPGRYAQHSRDQRFYGVALIKTYPLDDLPSEEGFLQDINQARQKEAV